VKDIELKIVVGASTREECEMHLLIEDFRGWIESVGRELLAD
jgi:hypothetical protein